MAYTHNSIKRMAQYVTHAAGLTRQSAALRVMQRAFKTGGQKIFTDHSQPMEARYMQDHDLMHAEPDFQPYIPPPERNGSLQGNGAPESEPERHSEGTGRSPVGVRPGSAESDPERTR